jgi:hypothetical protein
LHAGEYDEAKTGIKRLKKLVAEAETDIRSMTKQSMTSFPALRLIAM